MSVSRLMFVLLAVMAAFMVACGGGGGGTTPITPSQGGTTPPPDDSKQLFSVVLTATPDQGPSPMTVSFTAYAFGGYPTYSYEWDFDGDGVYDSNAVDPYWTFNNSAVVSLKVTDSRQQTVTVNKSITVTAGTGGGGTQPLVVRFQPSVNSGAAPLRVQFTALVSGGSPPYGFKWDFDGDGVIDSFSENPVYIYESPGTGGDGEYLFYPVLTVADNRGVEVSTADDTDADGQPDWRIAVNVQPPSALSPYATVNPGSGQAPLPVVFNGGASGGEPPYMFEWDFGDGTSRAFDSSAVAHHTYVTPGTYNARLTLRDNQGVEASSGVVPVFVGEEVSFSIIISADVAEGPVPFNVQFSSIVDGGREPISYEWEVFTDLVPTGDEPVIVLPPMYPTPIKDGQAVVVPDRTKKANPVVTFATYTGQYVDENGNGAFDSGEGVGAPYVMRCVATDANGVVAVSNLVRITPTQSEPANLYRAERTPTLGFSIYGGFMTGGATPISARANPATASHPSGMVYFFGGDRLSDSGEFQGIVDVTQSSYALNLTGQDRTPSGMFDSTSGTAYADGGFTLLNSLQGLQYAYVGQTPTVKTPPPQGTGGPPDCGGAFMHPSRNIQRSNAFVPRGSAAATMIHEDWDINPGGIGSCPG